jgi:WD40 repeat protein
MPVPASTPATPQSRGYFARLKDAVQAGSDWLFGFDFFISYSHRDGKNYPRKLLDALERSGYRVFLDQRDYMAGTELRSATDRRIRRSSVVVVISRPVALQSEWVGHEVNRTLALGRTPVVIDVNGSLSAADSETARLLMDRLHIGERIDDLDGDPSLSAVDELRRSFKGTRQESRRFRALAIGALAFCMLSIFAGWVAVVAVRQRNQAQQQNRISRARELAVTSVSQLGVDPQRSLALAVQSMELVVTDEGRSALRRALPNSRLRLTLRGDTGRITHVTFARDSRRLAMVADNGTVYVWDVRSGRVLDLRGHRGVVYGSRFSPDGTRLATAGRDSVAGLWDAATGGVVARLSADGDIDYVQFSPDGSRLLTAGGARPRVWDGRTGRFLFPLEGHESRSGPGAFSPDGQWIVTGGWEPRARIWDGHTGRLVRTLDMPAGVSVAAVAFSPDGRWVVATGDGITRVWKTDGWTQFRDIEGKHYESSFNGTGTLLLLYGPDGAEVWEAAGWTRAAVLGGATSAVFSPDGRRIATTSGERTVRVWDLVPGAEPNVAGRVLMELRQPDEQVAHAEFSPDGRTLVTAGEHTAHVWDVSEVAPAVSVRNRGDLGPLTLSDDGRWMVASTDQGAVVWDTRDWRVTQRLGGKPLGDVAVAAFFNGGRRLLVGGDQLYV